MRKQAREAKQNQAKLASAKKQSARRKGAKSGVGEKGQTEKESQPEGKPAFTEERRAETKAVARDTVGIDLNS